MERVGQGVICHGEDWHGLYRQDYMLHTLESNNHPAKMSWGVAFHILAHLDELGLLPPETTILDFMAGTGRTAIAACAYRPDLKAITVELEPFFRDLQGDCNCTGVRESLFRRMLKGAGRTRKLAYVDVRICPACQIEVDKRRLKKGPRTIFRSAPHFYGGNKAYAGKKLGRDLPWTILQGDARNLSDLLTERGLVGCISPPYGETMSSSAAKHCGPNSIANQGKVAYEYNEDGNPANIGNLPDRPIGIVSPPYADTVKSSPRKIGIDHMKSRILRPDMINPGPGLHSAEGVLPLLYGQTPGQIGSLPDRPVAIVSPPYMTANAGGQGVQPLVTGKGSTRGRGFARTGEIVQEVYGDSPGQIGKERQQSYLEAMRQVYAEAYNCCKVLVIVVKNPTRDGKLRRLDTDTLRILEACGWKLLCRHKAILFEEIECVDLFGETHKKVKGRLGFFKRLIWQKGAEIAKWEDAFFMVRDGEGCCGITSPPYEQSLAGDGRDLSKQKIFRDMEIKHKRTYTGSAAWARNTIGSTPGQIGNLK